jgi:60 kDa SS-A/Ro ribonucleoprotein
MISIPTDLFSFIGFVDKWGRGQKRAVADWFRLQADGSPRSGRSLAYLAFKYFQRDGWSVKDLLRLCHLKPSTCSLGQQIVLKCAVKGWDDTVAFVKESAESSKPDDMEDGKVSASLQEKLAGLAIDADLVSALHVYDSIDTDEARDVIETVRFLAGVSTAKMLGNSVEATALAVRLISKLGIPREMLPTHMLNSREIWDALLVRNSGEEARLCMPATAMVRNLPKMTIVGSLGDKVANGLVCDALSSTEYLRKARIHPIQMVAAKMTYGSGHGLRGSLSWSPISTVNTALERGIHASFENVESTGASIYAGVDVSPSMSSFVVEGLEMMKARDAAAIMALVFKKTETNVDVGMFSSGGGYGYGRSSDVSKVDGIVPCDLKASDTIAQAMRKLSLGPWGGTDCSLPIRKALKEKKVYDVFIILTDNDTWAGPEHASESLKRYRKAVNPRAKLVVIAFAACTYSIADPLDAGMMDMVGFDPSSPRILRDFILQGGEDEDGAGGAGAGGKAKY